MLSKTQKIWLWIFGAMFAVPEILWSPIGNFIYEFFQSGYSANTQPFRNNFLQNSDNLQYLKFIILLQFVGSLFFFVFWLINGKNIKSKLLFWIILTLSLLTMLTSFFALGFAFTFNINIG